MPAGSPEMHATSTHHRNPVAFRPLPELLIDRVLLGYRSDGIPEFNDSAQGNRRAGLPAYAVTTAISRYSSLSVAGRTGPAAEGAVSPSGHRFGQNQPE